MTTPAQIEAAAKALWRIGNERIGHREWTDVAKHYIAEAEAALLAASAAQPTASPQPSEIRFAEYLMCNILGEQANPEWQPDSLKLRMVSEALDGYVRAMVAKALANQVKP